ncbi:hypothetical protein [Argonema galeatum]|uniref:hypothetical protein n=1 Tax=Argonema galeatum TaxID=2942762 RepID=UPI0020139318|nr:hypothetical protein [Argonema galeatum]MCL1466862.1 hypothetical protein [Argonema galeatum A003/A1]
MFETLFIPNPSVETKVSIRPRKGVIIGAGMSIYDREGSPAPDNAALQEIFDRVKNAGCKILKRKGSTSYAIGLATTEIVKAILHGH